MFKSNGGFTLVELIVVIAILAILAGVAVPMYSGYIEKANEAADTQVLSAMNTAFAAACVENDVRPEDVTAAYTLAGGLGVTAVDGIVHEETLANLTAAIEADFNVYFGEGNTYKYYTDFTLADGNFSGEKADN